MESARDSQCSLREYLRLKRERRWVKRFVVVEATALFYFKNSDSTHPRCYLELQGATLIQGAKDFVLELYKDEVKLQLAFPHEASMVKWKDAITSCIQQANSHTEGDTFGVKLSSHLLRRIEVAQIQPGVHQKVKNDINRTYKLFGSKGLTTLYLENPEITVKKNREDNIDLLAVALAFAIMGVSTQIGIALLIGWVLYKYIQKPTAQTKRTSFKTVARINKTLGEVLTGFQDPAGWEPYPGTQATYQCVKSQNRYFVLEDASKSTFMVEDNADGKYCQITHYGTTTYPFSTSISTLNCFKLYIEPFNFATEQTGTEKLTLEDEDEEEEEKTTHSDLLMPSGISQEKKEQILSWNQNAVTVLNEVLALNARIAGWENFRVKAQGISASKLKGAHGLYIIRATGDIQTSVARIIDYLKPLNTKLDYDDMYETGHIIEEINEYLEVVYQKYKKQTGVSHRDFCLLQRRFDYPDGNVIAVACSIDHPQCPETSFVRAHLYMGCFILEPTSPTSTRMTYIVHADIKGSVPKWIINSVQEKQAYVVDKIRRVLTN